MNIQFLNVHQLWITQMEQWIMMWSERVISKRSDRYEFQNTTDKLALKSIIRNTFELKCFINGKKNDNNNNNNNCSAVFFFFFTCLLQSEKIDLSTLLYKMTRLMNSIKMNCVIASCHSPESEFKNQSWNEWIFQCFDDIT